MRIGIFGARGVAADGARRPDDAAANHETAAGVEPGPPVDVTASFPAKIRAHARRMKRFYERVRHRKDAAVFVKGALTPYTADLCLLDRCGAGFRLVRVALRRGELDRRTAFDVSPLGPAYLKALKRFLRRTGYCADVYRSPPRRCSTLRTLSSRVWRGRSRRSSSLRIV